MINGDAVLLLAARYMKSRGALPESSPAHGKTSIGGKPTAYVCIGPQCSMPVTEPAALVETVKEARQLRAA